MKRNKVSQHEISYHKYNEWFDKTYRQSTTESFNQEGRLYVELYIGWVYSYQLNQFNLNNSQTSSNMK